MGMNERIQSGATLIGGTINILAPAFVETFCAAGPDFIMLDLEHNLKDFSAVQSAIITADLYNVPVLVRPGEHSSNLVGRLLDAGAAGFVFPQVRTAKEAAEFISWCRYKPLGIRALGYNRSWARYEANDPLPREQANNDVFCLMVIEDVEGANNISSILDVDGVSGVAFGPGDLALEIGAKTWDDPRLVELLDRMAAATAAMPGKAMMRFTQTPEQARQNVASGANMMIMHHDVMLIRKMYTDHIASLREGGESAR
jgi:2-keto-3-deoxy-L-rhamnonate aldolase RhmA